jgi:DNA-binding PadR family transcriptional regulator
VRQSERPDKRLFSLTDAGRETLAAWLGRVEPIEPEDRDGVLLKVFFAAHGDPEAGRAQLLDWRGRVEARLATYREIEGTFEGEAGADAAARLQTLRLGIALMQASLGWADETVEALAEPEAARR